MLGKCALSLTCAACSTSADIQHKRTAAMQTLQEQGTQGAWLWLCTQLRGSRENAPVWEVSLQSSSSSDTAAEATALRTALSVSGKRRKRLPHQPQIHPPQEEALSGRPSRGASTGGQCKAAVLACRWRNSSRPRPESLHILPTDRQISYLV